jgi:hypothetical protein
LGYADDLLIMEPGLKIRWQSAMWEIARVQELPADEDNDVICGKGGAVIHVDVVDGELTMIAVNGNELRHGIERIEFARRIRTAGQIRWRSR